jgi:hypothetical protein
VVVAVVVCVMVVATGAAVCAVLPVIAEDPALARANPATPVMVGIRLSE